MIYSFVESRNRFDVIDDSSFAFPPLISFTDDQTKNIQIVLIIYYIILIYYYDYSYYVGLEIYIHELLAYY